VVPIESRADGQSIHASGWNYLDRGAYYLAGGVDHVLWPLWNPTRLWRAVLRQLRRISRPRPVAAQPAPAAALLPAASARWPFAPPSGARAFAWSVSCLLI